MRVLSVNKVSKMYDLGQVGTGTLFRDLNRKWAKLRGKPDPYATLAEINDRTSHNASGSVWALKDVSFEVKDGDVLGIIGRNGAGKSTLLKILSRITSPTEGDIKIKGRIASLLEVGTGMHPEMTARENIYLNGAIMGMDKKEIQNKFDSIVEFAGIKKYIDTPIKRFSSGMQVRLGFAVAAFLEPEILIVDEVLAVGDAEFQKQAVEKMQSISSNEGRTVLFVSHNMDSVRQLCTRAIVMDKGGVVFDGTTEEAIDFYLNRIVPDEFSGGKYITQVNVRQVEKKIVLEVSYNLMDLEFDVVHLGFAISNEVGHPVLGTNAITQSSAAKPERQEGLITVEIKDPVLRDGRYLLTLWFGDSKENYESHIDCLSFEIVGASSEKPFKLNPKLTGSVEPQCKWTYS
jgi:lipopolysaccharide transport system ATP-binding protein